MILMRSKRFKYGKLIIDDTGSWKFMVIVDIIDDVPQMDCINSGDEEDFNIGPSLYLLDILSNDGWVYHYHTEFNIFYKTYLFIKRKL